MRFLRGNFDFFLVNLTISDKMPLIIGAVILAVIVGFSNGYITLNLTESGQQQTLPEQIQPSETPVAVPTFYPTPNPTPNPTPTVIYKTITAECASPKPCTCPTISDQTTNEITQLKADVDNKNKEIKQLRSNLQILQTNLQAQQSNLFYWQSQAAFCNINYKPRL